MKEKNVINFSKFSKLRGSHPFKTVTPDGFVPYKARVRKGAKLRYFNFALAKEMGLISQDHDTKITADLEKVLIDTFSFLIINEYDIENDITYTDDETLDAEFMATRYLQLQHDDKKGTTSGDGRSVWNGQIKNQNKTWDISSCGTGATRLSPATTKFNKFFQNGDPTISYGCGYAEVDEGIAQALFSEVFFKNKIRTERALLVLEFEKNYAINVRAHHNLLRPSHFFIHLKQGNCESLKKLTDYYIQHQVDNDEWKDCPRSDDKYDYFLIKIAETFAQMSAVFENEYIFCWLDWDGDNILMDGSIIDYGSVRQFGLFHSEYRYDDVDRFSTTLLEQKEKAKYIVQSFAQAIDFIKHNEKKSIKDFKEHPCISLFERSFEEEKNRGLLRKIGIDAKSTEVLLTEKLKLVKDFRKIFSYFEKTKSHTGKVKVSDGITRDAVFCMRDILRELPKLIISTKKIIDEKDFIDILKSHYATKEDLLMTSYRSKMIKAFQEKYWDIITEVALINNNSFDKQILKVELNSSLLNKFSRVTGDSISLIVDKILKMKNKLTADETFDLIEHFSIVQSDFHNDSLDLSKVKNKDILLNFFKIVKQHREGL